MDASLSIFYSALEMARNCCCNDLTDGNKTDGRPYTVSAVRLSDNKNLSPLIQRAGDAFLSNDFDIFQRVFVLTRHGDEECQQVDDVEVLVLLYNFAFTLHMTGIISKDAIRRERAFRKALHVYKMTNACARSIRKIIQSFAHCCWPSPRIKGIYTLFSTTKKTYKYCTKKL